METPAKDPPEVLARFSDGLSLVEVHARQMRRAFGTRLTLDELSSFGHEGLLAAARTFDASLRVPFRHWAALRVRGAMIDGVRASGNLPFRVHNELRAMEHAGVMRGALVEENAANTAAGADAADSRLADYLSGMATAMALGFVASSADPEARELPPEEALARAELHAEVHAAILRLSELEQRLVQRQYFEDAKLIDTARELGMTPSWATRILSRAVETIARDLKRRKVPGPRR